MVVVRRLSPDAEPLVRSGSCLRIRGGKLVAVYPAANASLAKLLRSVLLPSALGTSPEPVTLSVRDAEGTPKLTLFLAAADAGALADEPPVLVFANEPGFVPAHGSSTPDAPVSIQPSRGAGRDGGVSKS